MPYNIKEKNRSELVIEIKGEFDSIMAGELQPELESYSNKTINNITFDLAETVFIASSGLRVIIIAKDKIGSDMNVNIANAKGIVLDTIKMCGINKFINVTTTE